MVFNLLNYLAEPVGNPTVDMPDSFMDTSLHQPAHTVATLRQLNFHYQQQIADLQRQLKTQAQQHKRQLSNSQQNGVNSEDNLRAILVDHKETITRLEKELTEKSKKAVTHAHDIEHIKYSHEQVLFPSIFFVGEKLLIIILGLKSFTCA